MFKPADINECNLGYHNCDDNATCSDTIGSFTCVCDLGYSGDGVTCKSELLLSLIFHSTYICYYTLYVDIDECSEELDNCDVNAVCRDTNGSFTCTCNEGFTGDGVTCSECVAID